MRNAARYRGMVAIYTLAKQMETMCDAMHSHTVSTDGALRDMIEAVKGRMMHIQSTANQAAMDEFDFGPQGGMFVYTLEQAIQKVLEKNGVIRTEGQDK